METCPAEISEIRFAPLTVDGVVTYKAILSVDNADLLLRPGMTASAEIVTEICENCLSVPIQSVAVRTLDQLGAEAVAEGEEPRFVPDSEGFVEIVWVVADGRAARVVKDRSLP